MKQLLIKLKKWLRFKTTKCDFCGRGLFRFGTCHGGVNVKENISGTKTKTAYLCNLCYHLFTK